MGHNYLFITFQSHLCQEVLQGLVLLVFQVVQDHRHRPGNHTIASVILIECARKKTKWRRKIACIKYCFFSSLSPTCSQLLSLCLSRAKTAQRLSPSLRVILSYDCLEFVETRTVQNLTKLRPDTTE